MPNIHTKIITLLLAVSTIFSSILLSKPAAAAGFDSKKAGTSIEKTICADTHLSMLDSQMKQVFDEAQTEHKGINGESGARIDPVGREQKIWLINVRNKCKNSSCIQLTYERRIDEIKQKCLQDH